MPKKIVGLIGNGKGPKVHTEGECFALVEGLKPGGVVTISIDTGEQFVMEEDGRASLGRPRQVSFEAAHASRELVCNVLMEI